MISSKLLEYVLVYQMQQPIPKLWTLNFHNFWTNEKKMTKKNLNYETCFNWSNNRWKFVVSKLVDGSGEQGTCPTKMSSIEQLIVIYLDNRSVFHKDNFFFSLDFFVLFYENRFYMPLHNWILQIALIALKIGSNETNVVFEENVLPIGSINQFRNYE